MQKTGVQLIADERLRQIKGEGFSEIKDDLHDNGQMEEYAKFLLSGNKFYFPVGWDPKWALKRFTRPHRENLIKAGALIAAELDRLNRKS